MFRKTKKDKWKKYANQSAKDFEKFAKWTPSHKTKLLAEFASVEEGIEDVSHMYDSAIKSACEGSNISDGGLVYETASAHDLEQGNITTASHHYGQAHNSYLKWGAKCKANHLILHSSF